MKTIVLILSRTFPAGHPKAGQETNFKKSRQFGFKKHTIRDNVEYWEKAAAQINAGTAYLSVREWTGRPYWSKPVEIERHERITVQRLTFDKGRLSCRIVNGWHLLIEELADHDGLSLEDFYAWFKDYDLTTPKAIIQFTEFEY